MFHVLILDTRPELSQKPIYEGNSSSVILPGTEGEFEILDFHKPIISKLKNGTIVVDNSREVLIQGGIAKMQFQSLVALVDLKREKEKTG
ncbi:MAG: hypothetical protein EXS63_04280 [Candidatus Omnitrophica bacterium]|nr:hypothetical protein [Candidatus Omnitrophota bacterium]